MPELEINPPLESPVAHAVSQPASQPVSQPASQPMSQPTSAAAGLDASAAYLSATALGAALSSAAFANPTYASFALPLPGTNPCGPNLEYDPDFHALQAAAAGKPERQYGASVMAAEPPDWPTVHQLALALAARTRDLRVVVWLIRSAARGPGFIDAVHGLQLLRALLETYWAQVHPGLEHDDDTGLGNDATARLSALGSLSQDAGLADLRAAALTPQRGSITVRELELAFGRLASQTSPASPSGSPATPGEPVPTEAGAVLAVAAAQAQFPALGEAMAQGLQAVRASVQVLQLQQRAGRSASVAPLDLTQLDKLLACVALAGQRAAQASAPRARTDRLSTGGAAGNVASSSAEHGSERGSEPARASAAGVIGSRDDAIQALERVCVWIELNEPSNPAPLLIQRAQRLMKKSFIEIIQDLVPESLGQIEKLAGPGRE